MPANTGEYNQRGQARQRTLTLFDLRELIDAVNSPAVGVCLDVEQVGLIGSPLDWIHTLHRRVKAVRHPDIPFSGESGANPISQSSRDAVVQALNDLSLPCALILCG